MRQLYGLVCVDVKGYHWRFKKGQIAVVERLNTKYRLQQHCLCMLS